MSHTHERHSLPAPSVRNILYLRRENITPQNTVCVYLSAQNAYQPAIESDQAHQRLVGAHEEGWVSVCVTYLRSILRLQRQEALRNRMLQEQSPRVAQQD
jgi:hypothetical protein